MSVAVIVVVKPDERRNRSVRALRDNPYRPAHGDPLWQQAVEQHGLWKVVRARHSYTPSWEGEGLRRRLERDCAGWCHDY